MMEDASSTESRASLIYIPATAFFVITPLLVGTRLWSRTRKQDSWGPDDWSILAALGCSLASSAVMLASCHYGYGRHSKSLPPEDLREALRYFYICQITYKACINLTKASILLLYLRIFGGVPWFRWSCIFLTGAVAIYCVASVMVTIFQCSPIQRSFDNHVEGICINIGQFWFANAGFSIATDLVILCLPMRLVYQLKVNTLQKAALVMVFAVGVFIVITSCLRVTTIDLQATSTDKTWDIASTMWTLIEMNVAIVCACLPIIRPLIVKLFPKILPSTPRELNGKVLYGSDLSKRCGGHTVRIELSPRSKSDNSSSESWARMSDKAGINMTHIRKGAAGSEEYILQDDRSMQIQKTVGYSVEYSEEQQRYHV